jgi:hypothetical protein
MEFLDISLRKDLILLLHAIHSLFFWQILKKTILFSGCRNPYKKSTKQEKSSLFMINILQNGKMMVENQRKTRVLEDSSLFPVISTKNAVKECDLRIGFHTKFKRIR